MADAMYLFNPLSGLVVSASRLTFAQYGADHIACPAREFAYLNF